MATRLVKRSALFLTLAAVLLAGSPGAAQQAEPPPGTGKALDFPSAGRTGRSKSEEAGKRLREGTRLIDVEGRFDSNGDRWIFFQADVNQSYKVLENIALERIHKVVEETRAGEKPLWTISATVTEYLGSNYLLVTKAVIKVPAVVSPPAGGSRAPARDAIETAPQITVETR
jgi:hypothetical protein